VIDSLQANKDKDRRNLLLCNDLSRQYRSKSNELGIKHQQLTRIHSDFEQKVQLKEVSFFMNNSYFILIDFYLVGRKSTEKRIN